MRVAPGSRCSNEQKACIQYDIICTETDWKEMETGRHFHQQLIFLERQCAVVIAVYMVSTIQWVLLLGRISRTWGDFFLLASRTLFIQLGKPASCRCVRNFTIFPVRHSRFRASTRQDERLGHSTQQHSNYMIGRGVDESIRQWRSYPSQTTNSLNSPQIIIFIISSPLPPTYQM